LNTIVFPVVRTDLIKHALGSFWQHNDRELHRVIVIDQSRTGLDDLVNAGLAHAHLRVHRNLGFAGASNRGIRLADTRYVTVSNDDVIWFDPRWWEGVMKIFNRDEKMVAVNPSCPKLPGWSFGDKVDRYIAGADSPEKCDWDTLKKETPLRGLVHGICMWCTTFDMSRLSDIGVIGDRGHLFDERFYPGGSEDYDLNARIFRAGGLAVGTHESWLWHYWGKSKDEKGHDGMAPIAEKPAWNRMGDLWEKGFTVQGGSARKTDEVYTDSL